MFTLETEHPECKVFKSRHQLQFCTWLFHSKYHEHFCIPVLMKEAHSLLNSFWPGSDWRLLACAMVLRCWPETLPQASDCALKVKAKGQFPPGLGPGLQESCGGGGAGGGSRSPEATLKGLGAQLHRNRLPVSAQRSHGFCYPETENDGTDRHEVHGFPFPSERVSNTCVFSPVSTHFAGYV